MADIFNSQPGRVAVFVDDNGQIMPGQIKMGNFAPVAALISGADYDQGTDHQFQMSMDRKVYVYVFGDKMGQVVVNGIAFPGVCNSDTQNGLLDILDYYRTYRASKNPDVVQVSIGGGADDMIRGFLIEAKIRSLTVANDPASFMSHWQLIVATLPEDLS